MSGKIEDGRLRWGGARRGGARRWVTVVAAAAGFTMVVTGCGAGATGATQKSVAEESSVVTVDLADRIGPIDEDVVTKMADGGDGKGAMEQGLLGDKENASQPRIHMFIANTADPITKRGERFASAKDKCTDRQASGLPKMAIPTVVAAVASGAMQESCLEGPGDPEVELTYTIAGSTDLLWIWSKVPVWGDNEVKCSILDPKTWKTNQKSAYTCTVQWLQDDGHGWNPMPKIKLWKKPTQTVTEPQRAQQLLKENCQVGMSGCTYKATVQTVRSLPKTQWIPYGQPQGNCIPDADATLTAGDEKGVSWTNMIGTSVTAEMSIGPVKAALEAKYEHVASESQSFREEHFTTIPRGKVVGFYIQLGVVHVEGDFRVVTEQGTYIIPDTEFNLPLNTDYRADDIVVRRGVIQPVAWDCDADSGMLQGAKVPAVGIPEGAEVLPAS